MWSSSGSPATLPRHTAGSSAPVDWDSLLPLLPESVRLLRQVLEDDAALHRLLEHCGGLTLRIPRRFPSEGHLLRALLPEPVLARRYGITDRRVWQLLKQEAELPDKALQAPGDALQG